MYGQNLFEFGSEIRLEYYFIGMAISKLLFSLCLYLSHKHISTSFLLWLCLGDLINELFYSGNLSYIEIIFGVIGVLVILLKDKIKWKR